MKTHFYIPPPPLGLFVDHFFYYVDHQPEHAVDRFLPDGEVQLIFDLTDTPKYRYHNKTLQPVQICRKVWFSGFRTEPITIPSGLDSEMVIVQFKKGKAFPFLKETMPALTNIVADAETVMDPELLFLRESLLDPQDPQQKFVLLEQQLLKRYLSHFKETPFVDFAVSTILATPQQCSIQTLSNKVGYSQKHLIQLFRNQVGVTPKTFLKVIRFQKAIQQLAQQQDIDWLAVAHDCGFYDQAHFIADFKHFSGFTPSEYLHLRNDMLNYVPVK
ncbi:MAG: helix-turn-helix domain-containing protein [Flavobacteriaceae bacterium]